MPRYRYKAKLRCRRKANKTIRSIADVINTDYYLENTSPYEIGQALRMLLDSKENSDIVFFAIMSATKKDSGTNKGKAKGVLHTVAAHILTGNQLDTSPDEIGGAIRLVLQSSQAECIESYIAEITEGYQDGYVIHEKLPTG